MTLGPDVHRGTRTRVESSWYLASIPLLVRVAWLLIKVGNGLAGLLSHGLHLDILCTVEVAACHVVRLATGGDLLLVELVDVQVSKSLSH